MTNSSHPCEVIRKLIEDLPGEHRYVFNCSVCQRDLSDEWSERRCGESDAPAVANLEFCPCKKAAKKFLTIGYGGTEPEALVRILRENGVKAVVDVRIWPHRASMGSYVLAKSPEKGIQHLLEKVGIQYYSFVELGNLFLQFDDWQDRYRQLLSSSGNLLTERLLNIPGKCCLLCSEKQPSDCHRSIIADFLIQEGHKVEHFIASAPRLRE